MKLSQVNPDTIRQMPADQINRIVFGHWTDDGSTADVALLLGGNPLVLPGRAKAAADLYKAGRVCYIIPSGGVEWDTEKGRMTESEYMVLCLKDLGVPEDRILLENEARTTVENMLFATILMNRKLKIRNLRRIAVVTSPSHLRRSMTYAENLLPRRIETVGYTDLSLPDGPDCWQSDPFYANRVYREAELLFTDVSRGWCDDIEF